MERVVMFVCICTKYSSRQLQLCLCAYVLNTAVDSYSYVTFTSDMIFKNYI